MSRDTITRSQAGLTLVEVLVTVVILLIGLLGMATLMANAQKAEAEAYQRAQALLLLQDMVGRINANRAVAVCYAITASRRAGPRTWARVQPSFRPAASGSPTAYTLANADLNAWNDLLIGTTEILAGNNVGTLLGARGCVTLDGPNAAIPSASRGRASCRLAGARCRLTCGTGLYGDERPAPRGQPFQCASPTSTEYGHRRMHSRHVTSQPTSSIRRCGRASRWSSSWSRDDRAADAARNVDAAVAAESLARRTRQVCGPDRERQVRTDAAAERPPARRFLRAVRRHGRRARSPAQPLLHRAMRPSTSPWACRCRATTRCPPRSRRLCRAVSPTRITCRARMSWSSVASTRMHPCRPRRPRVQRVYVQTTPFEK